MKTPGTFGRFKIKSTYPTNQTWAHFTEEFDIKVLDTRIQLSAHEEVIDDITYRVKTYWDIQ